jgi:hypothetical protein
MSLEAAASGSHLRDRGPLLTQNTSVCWGQKWGSVEEAQHLATNLLSAGLVVVHDASSGGHHDLAEL